MRNVTSGRSSRRSLSIPPVMTPTPSGLGDRARLVKPHDRAEVRVPYTTRSLHRREPGLGHLRLHLDMGPRRIRPPLPRRCRCRGRSRTPAALNLACCAGWMRAVARLLGLPLLCGEVRVRREWIAEALSPAARRSRRGAQTTRPAGRCRTAPLAQSVCWRNTSGRCEQRHQTRRRPLSRIMGRRRCRAPGSLTSASSRTCANPGMLCLWASSMMAR